MLTEILQGIGDERQAREVEATFAALPLVRLRSPDDFVLAADLYRTAARAGATVRRTLDCLIAAPCVRQGAPILHADADFDRLASCTPLRVLR